jgi:hypothetical protein
MTTPRGPRLTRPYRRLRRWARHTPNGTIALNLIGVGILLVFVAVLMAFFAR